MGKCNGPDFFQGRMGDLFGGLGFAIAYIDDFSQEGHRIAFNARKLNPALARYTTTEMDLLSTVEVLKELRKSRLGQQFVAHTDHKNLRYKTKLNSERVNRWRL